MPGLFRRKVVLIGMLAVGLLGLPSLACGAFTIANENFDYTTPTSLNGQNGGTGWNGAWTAASGQQVVTPTTALSVTNTALGTVSGSGGALEVTGSNANIAFRRLSEATATSIEISFLFRFTGAVDNNDFFAFWFDSNPSVANADRGNVPNIGLKGNRGDNSPSTGEDLFVRTSLASSGDVNETNTGYTTNLVSGTTYYLVGTLSKTGGSTTYNRWDFRVFDDGGTTVATVGVTGPSALSSIDRIGIRAVNLDSGDSVLIDNLQVAAVPAPAGLVLAVVGAGCLLGYRRLRRRPG